MSAGSLVEQPEELIGLFESSEQRRNVFLFGELCDFAEYRKVLIRHFEGWRNDQEEVVHWLVIDRLEFDASSAPSVGQT